LIGSCASKLFLGRVMQSIELRETRMRVLLLVSIAFGLVGSSVLAQDRKGIRFWNLTTAWMPLYLAYLAESTC